MRKPELASAIAADTNITKEKANEVINAVTDEITNALASGNSVNLIGFGSFSLRNRSERTGKNPQTGEAITIPASTTVGFKAGKALKESCNG